MKPFEIKKDRDEKVRYFSNQLSNKSMNSNKIEEEINWLLIKLFDINTTKEKEFSRIQVVALFGRLTSCGCFRTDRDYNIAKELLKSHLDVDYDNYDYYEFKEETDKVVHSERQIK